MIVICLIQVVFVHFASTAPVRGYVKGSSETHYLVDFSAAAKANAYEGDYSLQIVPKNKCVEVTE